MAKKNHIVPTQVISMGGYSLSLMLLVFAAALYLGWLPSQSNQAGLTEQKPAVPVVKSPEIPAKVKVAEEATPQPEPETLPETPESDERQDIVSSEQPAPPEGDIKTEADPEEGEPTEPKPQDSALIESREHHTSEAFPLGEETSPRDALTQQQSAQDQTDRPKEPTTEESNVVDPPRVGDTLTAEDLRPEAGAESENQQPSKQLVENNAAGTAEADPPVEETTNPLVPLASKTNGQTTAQPKEPRVRIVAPPPKSAPPKQSPSVVIRIPSDPSEDLKVLPPPAAVPTAEPKRVQQSPTIVVRIPQAEKRTRDQSLRPVVPRAKPSKAARAESKTSKPAPVDPPRPSASKIAQPSAHSAKTDATNIEGTDAAAEQQEFTPEERAPQPLAKPKRLSRVSVTHTATIARQQRVRKRTKRKPTAKAQRIRAKRPVKAAKQRTKGRRTKLAKPRIHRPPTGNRISRQAVSYDQETYCLAIAIYYEAGRKNLRDQVAISREILHRVESFNFPNSVCEVVYQYAHRRGRCRYAFACDGLPDRPKNRSVWRRAKMLAKAQINCGARCGCYLKKSTLVSSASGRARRVIRCQAGVRGPAPRQLANSGRGPRLQIRPAASRTQETTVSHLGRR